MISPATHDSLRARIDRIRHPGYSWCGRCGWTWASVEYHLTSDSASSGCFPLCESCWSKLSIDERLPYYDRLVMNWISDSDLDRVDELTTRREQIRDAVRAGQ